jgi:2-succinyl-6-hydroxy-2,4-cyclohexadiene-1-carboxylate synthase
MVSLFSRLRHQTLEEWGAGFARSVARQDPSPIVVGYSLGGRLALHALLARPEGWRGAIIISAHTGLDDVQQRLNRAIEDVAWARRFEADAWEDVVRDWDARETFAGRHDHPPRLPQHYSRPALAGALEAWSLGRQQPLAGRLAAIQCPVLWMVGADDHRFVAEAERAMQYLPRGTMAIAPGTAHRVPWETPEWFHASACDFLSTLS